MLKKQYFLGSLRLGLLLGVAGFGCGSTLTAKDAAGPVSDAGPHADATVDGAKVKDAMVDLAPPDVAPPICLLAADGSVGTEPCPGVADASTGTCTEAGRVCVYATCGGLIKATCMAGADGGPLDWYLQILINQ
jgi:hypothetical protein